MKSYCSEEQRALLALRTGVWEEALQNHFSGCSVCQEVAQVSACLQELAIAQEGGSLPDPHAIWLKAQWMQRRTAVEQATRPLAIFQFAALAFVATALLAWVAGHWTEVDAWLAQSETTWLNAWSNFTVTPVAVLMFWLVAAFSSVSLLTTLYLTWSEE